ncbi:MAG: hypothetical protein OEW05_06320 [Candidatus Aminicenantes bacterium]|nr:hypothetical protein [Candidatus Aminicenantes bacterium]
MPSSLRRIALASLAASSLAFAGPFSQRPQQPAVGVGIEHAPVADFTQGAPLEFRARASAPVEWLSVFLRYEGIEEFQARPMSKAEDGSYGLTFDTGVLPAAAFEYYLGAGTAAGIVTFPAAGRDGPLRVAGRETGPAPEIPADIPAPTAETAPPSAIPFPVKVSGSVQATLKESVEVAGAEALPASGNLRVFYTPQRLGGVGASFDSNFIYSNTPTAGAKDFDLSNMNVAVYAAGHTLRAGDLALNESDYSVQSSGRRGFEYAFDNQRAYLHVFSVNSQQVRGFKGFGLPKAGVTVAGGAAGYKFFDEALALKAVFVTGKDTPSRGANIGLPDYLSGYGGREGQVVALTEETRLFQNRFNLKAEFAHSRYDADTQDAAGAAGDSAYTLGAGLAAGFLNAAVNYRHIGRDFNSIGLDYIAGNRRLLEATFGLARGPFSLTGVLRTQRDNVKDDPLSATTRDRGGDVNLSVSLSTRAQLMFGYRRGRQKTEPGLSPAFSQDSATDELAGTMNVMLGTSSSVNLSVISSNLDSRASPESAGSALTVNLGAALRAGETLSLSPNVGVSRRKDKLTGDTFDTYNALAVGELFILPRAWSMFLSASFNRADFAGGSATDMLDLMGGLNFYFNRLIKVEGLLLALKGNYRQLDAAGVRTTEWRALAQCDFAF